MAKPLKKMTVFLLMLTIILMMKPVTAKAQEERCAVYVQVPEDWESPCLWAWDEAGNNAFAAWPGGEMDADKKNEGWYYIWIPSWANHIIINANEGDVQTGELILEGGNVWITVTDPENAQISYEALTDGEIPEYVEKFVIHANVPESWTNPCLRAGAASDGREEFEELPGEPLKKGDDEWYTGKAPIWVDFVSINGNDGAVSTEDISIDPAEIWIEVGEDGSCEFSYDDPNAVAVPDIHVYVKVPGDWESPCLWAWSAPDGTNAFASWPGEAFAEGEDGWLVLETPGWVNSVIINGNKGDVQTTDLSVDTGKDLWVVVEGSEECQVSYEEPEISGEEGKEEITETTDTEETVVKEPAQTQKDEEKTGTGTIVLIVVILVIIVALAVFFVRKKRKA